MVCYMQYSRKWMWSFFSQRFNVACGFRFLESTSMKSACTLCWLHKHCKVVKMMCAPNKAAPLQVFVDQPTDQDDDFGQYGTSRVSRLMMWMLEKWTLYPEEVGINFTVRCAGDLKKKADKIDAIKACSVHSEKYIECAKAILGLGELSCLRLLERPIANAVYQEDKRTLPVPVFISYSPGFFLQNPSDVVAGLRMVKYAADAAGLKPVFNKELALFDFGKI